MKRTEIAYKELGIVTLKAEHDGLQYQIATYDSMCDLKDKINLGTTRGLFEKPTIEEMLRSFTSSEWSEWKDFIFQGKFKNMEEVNIHMEQGLAINKTLDYIEKFRNTSLQTEEIQELKHRAKSMKKRRVFSEVGSELDIDRVLCGDPEHWSYMKRGAEKSVMKIGFNIGMVAAVTDEQVQQVLAMGIILTELLQLAGITVELHACYLGINRTTIVKHGGMMVKIKGAEERLDIQRISGIACSGIYRSYGFLSHGNVLDCKKHGCEYGFGRSGDINDNLKALSGMDYIIDNSFSNDQLQILVGNLLKTNGHDSN